MNEVSCRAFSFFRALEGRGLVDVRALLAGLSVDAATLDEPDRRMPWDVWVELCDRLARTLDADAFARAARIPIPAVMAGDLPRVASLAGFADDPVQLYRLGVLWGAAALFRAASFTIAPRADGALDIECTIAEPFRGSTAWLQMVEGALVALPTPLGRPESVVERLVLGDRHAAWRVVPVGGRATSPLAASIVDVLVGQQEQLGAAWTEMRASERAFRNTLDALPVLVVVHEAGQALYVSRELARFLGAEPESLVGRSVLDWATPTSRPLLASLVAGEIGGRLRFELMRSTGVPGWIEAEPVAGIEFGGQRASAIVARDVTDELLTRARLERSEDTVHALLRVFPDVILRVDAEARLLDVQGGSTLLGREALAARIGTTLTAEALTTYPPLTEPMAEELVDALRADVNSRVAMLALSGTAEGGPTSVSVRFVPAGHDETLIILHDDTEQRAIERRLASAERLTSVGALASGVAHEINNPLTYILTNLWLVRETFGALPEGPQRDEMLAVTSEIEAGARRIRDTVARMRSLSRVEPTRKEPFAPRDAVVRALDATSNELRHRAEVGVDLGHTGRVVGDENELTQAIVNLLMNAAQAIADGRPPSEHSIRIVLREEGSTAVIEIEDSGAGIASEHLGRIFDPFFTTKTAASGTGLGLTVVHRTVTNMGGRVEAVSEPGKGALLRVLLPLEASEPISPSAPTIPALRDVRLRVLVVDDDPLVGRALVRVLKQHDVSSVSDGEEAVRLILGDSPPDLVLCDLMMPGLSGMDVWERVKAGRPDRLATIVFVTGGAFTERAELFLQHTVVKVLKKPLAAGELRSVLAEIATRVDRLNRGA